MDVCDDADYSQMLKGYGQQAKEAGVPAITSTGHFLKEENGFSRGGAQHCSRGVRIIQNL